ncbi:MAG: hypothetical protein FJ297_01310 [Planctomycetes bacterium]|nr:hypothetical protein [Planctomycetota bacterium]
MHDPQQVPPIFRIDVSADTTAAQPTGDHDRMVVFLLRQLLASQERQNQLIEELNRQFSAAQRQRATELQQWKDAHPEVAQQCRAAAETLSRVQTEFLQSMAREVVHCEDALMDGEFMLNEFVDRYGPRLAHLNGLLQVFSQLSGTA